jgi:hypothetical protein
MIGGRNSTEARVLCSIQFNFLKGVKTDFCNIPGVTFVCPNQPEVQAALGEHIQDILLSGKYQRIFLDRIRFPSPAADIMRDLACFCPACQVRAVENGLDLERTRRIIQELAGNPVRMNAS